jgi:hypothetical protein
MSLVQDNLLKLATRINPTTKAGKRFGSTTNNGIAIASSSGTSPIVITTSVAHGRSTGDVVTINGHATNTAANNTAANPTWTIIVTAPTTFSLTGSVYTAAGGGTGTVTPFMVGSVDGSRYSKQRLLDIYNESRFALFNALNEMKSYKEFSECVHGTRATASITIASYSSPYRTIAKPTGFIKFIDAVDSASTPVRINILPDYMLNDVKSSVTASLTPSNANLLAFEIGSTWSIVGNFGTTPAIVDYYGITNWTWVTDVLPNTTVELFRSDLEPLLIQIGEAIANNASNAEVLALAKNLLTTKG